MASQPIDIPGAESSTDDFDLDAMTTAEIVAAASEAAAAAPSAAAAAGAARRRSGAGAAAAAADAQMAVGSAPTPHSELMRGYVARGSGSPLLVGRMDRANSVSMSSSPPSATSPLNARDTSHLKPASTPPMDRDARRRSVSDAAQWLRMRRQTELQRVRLAGGGILILLHRLFLTVLLGLRRSCFRLVRRVRASTSSSGPRTQSPPSAMCAPRCL